MSRYGFLRTRRWIALALVAVVIATACVFLGIWQWNRHEDRAAANDLINTNYDMTAEPMPAVVEDAVAPGQVWRSVTVSGSYTGEQLVVRNRPVDGTAAARVLALLETDGGPLLVVDRGWLPLGDGDLDLPAYPDGEVTLTGRLREAEAADSRTPPTGQVYRIEPGSVARAAGADDAALLDGYLLATTEDGTAPAGLQAFPRPETTPGSHLSYAFQWWVFAGGALVGFVILTRREAAELGPVQPVRAPRRRTDADEEDALIDAQLHHA